MYCLSQSKYSSHLSVTQLNVPPLWFAYLSLFQIGYLEYFVLSSEQAYFEAHGNNIINMGVKRIAKIRYFVLIIVFIWTVLHMFLTNIIPSICVNDKKITYDGCDSQTTKNPLGKSIKNKNKILDVKRSWFPNNHNNRFKIDTFCRWM